MPPRLKPLLVFYGHRLIEVSTGRKFGVNYYAARGRGPNAKCVYNPKRLIINTTL